MFWTLPCAIIYFVASRFESMAQNSAKTSRRKGLTPFGVISLVIGLALFAYFVKKAGVGQIADGIRRLGAGFILIVGISALRQIARSIAWTLCMEAPYQLRLRDAFRARVMGDAIGNILPFAGFIVSVILSLYPRLRRENGCSLPCHRRGAEHMSSRAIQARQREAGDNNNICGGK